MAARPEEKARACFAFSREAMAVSKLARLGLEERVYS
jgi:hypothetical protein